MIADNGVIIRTHTDDISTYSRLSQGVKIMKLRGNSKIVSVALTKREDEEEVSDDETLNEQEEQVEEIATTETGEPTSEE